MIYLNKATSSVQGALVLEMKWNQKINFIFNYPLVFTLTSSHTEVRVPVYGCHFFLPLKHH